MDKIEVFGRVLSQEEIEHVFLKAKKLQEENKILKEGLQKFRLTNDEMLEFARAGELAYGGK